MKTGLPAIKKDEHWTYAHYKTWPDDERWELIHGVAYNMSAAPSTRHQAFLMYLVPKISRYLEGKPCRAFFSPFDVLLPTAGEDDDEVDNVVQPDLVVFCDRSKITEKGARGAPDFAVEILSPSTSRKDQREKFDLYQEMGVREYWVADPIAAWICRYVRSPDGRFDNGTIREYHRPEKSRPETRRAAKDHADAFLESLVLEGFRIDIKDCFESLEWK